MQRRASARHFERPVSRFGSTEASCAVETRGTRKSRSRSVIAHWPWKDKYAGDSAYQIAEVHAFRGEVDLACEWLERAYAQRDGGVTELKSDRLMRGLVGDPRYKELLRKLKLPE